MGKMSLFASGLVLGGVLAVAAYVAWHAPGTRPGEAPTGTEPVGPQLPQSSQSLQQPGAAALPAVATAAPPVVPGPCGFDAVLEPSGPEDRQFDLRKALATQGTPDANAFFNVARETAAEGREHDTEVALIAACRAAARISNTRSVLLADAQARLGQHYADSAGRQPSEAAQEQALQRARQLLSDSVDAYATAIGKNASKTRMAQRRLASLDSRPASAGTEGSDEEMREQANRMGAARQQSGSDLDEAIVAGPCGARGTAAARIACADPEVAQLDNDLRRLGAQAAHVTRDRAGFQRRAAQALAQRDASCQDKACLLRWYAQRRKQLLDEF